MNDNIQYGKIADLNAALIHAILITQGASFWESQTPKISDTDFSGNKCPGLHILLEERPGEVSPKTLLEGLGNKLKSFDVSLKLKWDYDSQEKNADTLLVEGNGLNSFELTEHLRDELSKNITRMSRFALDSSAAHIQQG